MLKKIILSIFIFGFFLALFISQRKTTYSQDECSQFSGQDRLNCLEKVTTRLRQSAGTLSSEIRLMDTQIELTELQIQQIEQKILQTTNEINTLNDRIDGLDNSLDYLSKQLLERVVDGYKKQVQNSMLNVMLNSIDAQNLLNRFKYVKTARDNNQKLLVQVQQAKLNFEDQKKLRETKKVQLDELNKTLTAQQANLNAQKSQKQKLLSDTQNDEATYQRLLAQARAQISAFKSFVSTSGASSIVGANALGSGSDGNYYSQRDSRWASQNIGNSSENILNVGCLLTSIAMVLKKNGVDTSPSAIASNTNYFSLNTAFMKFRSQFNPWPGGLNNSQISVSQVDAELEQGRYVIAGINYGACGGSSDHFVVLTKKDGGDYKMHDPIYGPDINFSSHYSQICYAEVFR